MVLITMFTLSRMVAISELANAGPFGPLPVALGKQGKATDRQDGGVGSGENIPDSLGPLIVQSFRTCLSPRNQLGKERDASGHECTDQGCENLRGHGWDSSVVGARRL